MSVAVVVSAAAVTVAASSIRHAWHHPFDRLDALMAALTIFCLAYLVYAVWVLPNEKEEEKDDGAEK